MLAIASDHYVDERRHPRKGWDGKKPAGRPQPTSAMKQRLAYRQVPAISAAGRTDPPGGCARVLGLEAMSRQIHALPGNDLDLPSHVSSRPVGA